MWITLTFAILTITSAKGSYVDPNATHYDYQQGIGRIKENFHYIHFNINTTTFEDTYHNIVTSYGVLYSHPYIRRSDLLKQCSILREEIYQNLQQIIPFHNKAKRGLINGLGTAIKYIFGNPDANDLQYINNYLNSLDHQQQEDIMILNKSVSAINKISKKINDHTDIINKNLESISETLNRQDADLHLYEAVITLIIQEQHFLDLLCKIKRSFIFSEQIFDLEILTYDQTSDMRSHLLKIYSQKELMLYHHNLLDFRFIQGSIVLTKTSIIYTLKIPILNPIEFSLFQRLATINYNNKTEIITTPWKLIGPSVRLFANKCQQMHERNYLCQQLVTEEVQPVSISMTSPLVLAYSLANNLTLISSNYPIYIEYNNSKTIFYGTSLIKDNKIKLQGYDIDENFGELTSPNVILPLIIKDHQLNFEPLKTLTLSPIDTPKLRTYEIELHISLTTIMTLSIIIISGLIVLLYKRIKRTQQHTQTIDVEDVIELRPGGVI